MQSAPINWKILQTQQWERIWPARYLTAIAIGQTILTIAVVGLETWSMLLNIKFTFLFIGYIAALFFIITWISTFIVVYCNRGSQNYIRHTLLENCLSVIAASVLLYYDARFLKDPLTCLWPGKMCSRTDWHHIESSWWKNYDMHIQDMKRIAIQIQLACAAAMCALCLIFIVVYFRTNSKVKASMRVIFPQDAIGPVSQQSIAVLTPVA